MTERVESSAVADRRRFLGGLVAAPVLLGGGLMSGGCASTALQSASTNGNIERRYVSGRFGQIHVHRIVPAVANPKTPLMCFHPSPATGAYYQDYMRAMGTDRTVMAMDTPGYGNSDRPPQPPTIEELAFAAADALDALGYGAQGAGPVDVIGYHTGCLIAAELAVLRPDLVRRLVLPGIPFYEGKAQADAYANYAKPKAVNEDGSHIMSSWKFWVHDRNEGVSLARGSEHFAMEMQAGPKSWWAYHGVFSWRGDLQLPKVKQPVLIPRTSGSLRDRSLAASKILPNAQVVELPDLVREIFVVGIGPLERVSRAFLD